MVSFVANSWLAVQYNISVNSSGSWGGEGRDLRLQHQKEATTSRSKAEEWLSCPPRQ